MQTLPVQQEEIRPKQNSLKLVKRVYRAWMKVAHFIGKVNTLILLTVFYFVILGIARLAILIFRKDLMGLGVDGRKGYWRERKDFTLDRTTFLRPY